MTSEGKKNGGEVMLVSSAMTPWMYQEWEDATIAKFEIADFADFLTGVRSSQYEEPRPRFGWALETEVRVRDPSSDASALRQDLRGAMWGEEGGTRPYAFVASSKGELEESPVKGPDPAQREGTQPAARAYRRASLATA
jgi:hypothetical protein